MVLVELTHLLIVKPADPAALQDVALVEHLEPDVLALMEDQTFVDRYGSSPQNDDNVIKSILKACTIGSTSRSLSWCRHI